MGFLDLIGRHARHALGFLRIVAQHADLESMELRKGFVQCGPFTSHRSVVFAAEAFGQQVLVGGQSILHREPARAVLLLDFLGFGHALGSARGDRYDLWRRNRANPAGTPGARS